MSLAKKGKKFSTEHKEKLRQARIGRKHSLETRRKIGEKQKGERNHFWEGGTTHINKKLRITFEYREWRKLCLERDNYTCQKTGRKDKPLDVHHINNFSSDISGRSSIENGITLSRESHREFHSKYGRKGNNREQLLKFLKNN